MCADDSVGADGAPVDYAEQLSLIGRLTEPAIRQAARDLDLRPGSRGLDAGCGVGRPMMLLKELVGPSGRVVGLDLRRTHLAAARGSIANCSLQAASTTPSWPPALIQGDLVHLPFGDRVFDWAWCADTLWPSAFPDPVAGIRELARVVRPGGLVTLLYGSSQILLPGHPALEARLNNAFAATAPYLGGLPSRLHFLRALDWLLAAGLECVLARTYVADLRTPVTSELRRAMSLCLDMFWGNLQGHVSPEDWSAFRCLCGDGGGRPLFDDPGYYGFITYTAFSGRNAARA